MFEGVSIRVAREGDVELARALTNRSWLSTYPPLIGEQATRDIIADRHSKSRFAAQAVSAENDPAGMFLVAEKDGTVVGHCYALGKDGCYVDRLHIAPELKGRGIGRALLDYVEASQLPGTRIWLDVLEGNDSAMAFYRKVGFKECGRTPACGGLAGIPAVIFEKTLAGPSDIHQEGQRI